MAVPVKLLMAAAAQIAQSQQAQKVGRALLDVGSDAVTKRLKRSPAKTGAVKPASPQLAAVEVVSKPRRAKAKWRQSLDRKMKFRSGKSGDLIRFEYTDEHGLKTQRMVGNWLSDGKYLTGLCLNMKCECDFELSGITDPEEIEVK